MAQVQLKKCNTCNEKDGSLYCYECKKFLCDTCRKFHDKFTKGHCVKDSKQIESVVLNAEVTCKTHCHEYSNYCQTCSCLICDKCAFDDHKQHDFCRVDQIAKEGRGNLQKITFEAKRKAENIIGRIKELERYKEKVLPNHKTALENDLKDSSKKIVDAIEGVTIQNLKKIKNAFETESNRVETNLNELKRKEGRLQQVIRETEQKLKIEHDVTFIAIQRQDNVSEDVEGSSIESSSYIKEKFDEAKFVKQCIEEIGTRVKGNNPLADEVKQLRGQNRQLHINNKELHIALKSFKEELEKCRSDNSSLRAEIDRLRTSVDMVPGADLSDPYRPQPLSEKCNSLYDNSWADAFESMKGTDEKNEKHVCEFLLKIFMHCWRFCLEMADKQLYRIPDLLSCDLKPTSKTKSLDKSSPLFKLCKDIRRLLTKDFISNLCQVYWESRREVALNRNIQPYVFACIELCWYSAISDPPLVFDFVGRNPEDFKVYTKSGSKIDYIVWPAMYLHEKGPLLNKGVLQCK